MELKCLAVGKNLGGSTSWGPWRRCDPGRRALCLPTQDLPLYVVDRSGSILQAAASAPHT